MSKGFVERLLDLTCSATDTVEELVNQNLCVGWKSDELLSTSQVLQYTKLHSRRHQQRGPVAKHNMLITDPQHFSRLNEHIDRMGLHKDSEPFFLSSLYQMLDHVSQFLI